MQCPPNSSSYFNKHQRLYHSNILPQLKIMSKVSFKSDFLAMNVSWHPNELELYTNQSSITMSTFFTIVLIITFPLGVIVQTAIFKMLKRHPQRAINQMIYPYMVNSNTFSIYTCTWIFLI